MRPRLLTCLVATALLALAGCTQAKGEDEEKVSLEPPRKGECRVLEPADLAKPTDATTPVPCTQQHTAETFLVGEFGDRAATAGYDDRALGAEVHRVCGSHFRRFTGADESLALRTVLSWAWFRPSEEAWGAGARWFRCDVVGGSETASRLVTLPETAKGVLLGIPGDRWMACVAGPDVTSSPWTPCTEPHDWRAVTTIVVGKAKDRYPGHRMVEVLSRDYCSDSVGAWMNYPVGYRYAYTWFHEAEWKAGNRRSICWAGTDR